MKFSSITFISDYGNKDGYVGVVHSVLGSLVPEVKVIDLSHNIEPYSYKAASLVLARASEYLNPGVVIAAVNPAGSRPIIIEVGDGQSYLIGPDNGIFAPTVAIVGGATKAGLLNKSEYYLDSAGKLSDCRDIYAPIAAEICNGVGIEQVSEMIDPVKLVPGLLAVSESVEDGSIASEVLWIDNFGNAQINIEPDQIKDWGNDLSIEVNNMTHSIVRVDNATALDNNKVGFVVDSFGLLSLTVPKESVAERLNLVEGSSIIFHNDAYKDSATVSVSVEIGKSENSNL